MKLLSYLVGMAENENPMTTLTPAAERKRQQRARAAAGQVHRVAVYLTEEELDQAVGWSLSSDAADGLTTALAYAEVADPDNE